MKHKTIITLRNTANCYENILKSLNLANGFQQFKVISKQIDKYKDIIDQNDSYQNYFDQ